MNNIALIELNARTQIERLAEPLRSLRRTQRQRQRREQPVSRVRDSERGDLVLEVRLTEQG